MGMNNAEKAQRQNKLHFMNELCTILIVRMQVRGTLGEGSMLKIAICEDTAQDIKPLEEHITRYMGDKPYTLKTFIDADTLLSALPTESFDIFFMDILLNSKSCLANAEGFGREVYGENKDDDIDQNRINNGDYYNGIDLALRINHLQPDAQIIYQSSYLEFFRNIYKSSHIYFLLKPIQYEDFFSAMNKASVKFEKSHIIVRNKERLRCADILFIELVNHERIFYLITGQSITSRMKTADLFARLPAQFIRCHKGYIVNIEAICRYDVKSGIKLENGQVIPVGRRYAHIVNEAIIEYWGDSIKC